MKIWAQRIVEANEILNYIAFERKYRISLAFNVHMKFSQPMSTISSSQRRMDENWLNSRRKSNSGRRKRLLHVRHWKKPITITVVCRTAYMYLSWAFLVIYCPHWLGSFVGHNYLEHSAGLIFIRYIFVGFIFRGCLHPAKINPSKISPMKICAHENLLIYGIFHSMSIGDGLTGPVLARLLVNLIIFIIIMCIWMKWSPCVWMDACLAREFCLWSCISAWCMCSLSGVPATSNPKGSARFGAWGD